MTTDTGEAIRFWAHRRLAREAFAEAKILSGKQFDLIAREMVSAGLQSTPKLF